MGIMYGALMRHLFRSVTDSGGGGTGAPSGATGAATPPVSQGGTGSATQGTTPPEGGDDDVDDSDLGTADLESLKAKLLYERRRRAEAERTKRKLEADASTRSAEERRRQEAEDASKGEWERVASTREREREEWKAKYEQAEVARIEERKHTALQLAAAAKNFADPMDASLYIPLDTLALDDKGQVKAETVTKALDTLITARPYLVKGERPPGMPHTPGTNGAPQTATSAVKSYLAQRYNPKEKK